jgi:hypothetical protein
MGPGRDLRGARALPAEGFDGRVPAAGNARPGCCQPLGVDRTDCRVRSASHLGACARHLFDARDRRRAVGLCGRHHVPVAELSPQAKDSRRQELPLTEPGMARAGEQSIARGGRSARGHRIFHGRTYPARHGRRRCPLERSRGRQPQRHAVVADRRGGISAGLPRSAARSQGGLPDAGGIRVPGADAGRIHAGRRRARGERRGARREARGAGSRLRFLAPRASRQPGGSP